MVLRMLTAGRFSLAEAELGTGVAATPSSGAYIESMSTFVPGGQAGEESQRMTHEAELHALQRGELQDAKPPKRSSVVKRILDKLRRAQ